MYPGLRLNILLCRAADRKSVERDVEMIDFAVWLEEGGEKFDGVPPPREAVVKAHAGRPQQGTVLAHVELGHLHLLLGGPDLDQAAPGQVQDQNRRNVLDQIR